MARLARVDGLMRETLFPQAEPGEEGPQQEPPVSGDRSITKLPSGVIPPPVTEAETEE